MYVYIYIYIYVYIYIYIYIYICMNIDSRSSRQNITHQESQKSEIPLEHATKVTIHRAIPVQIHWTGDNPLGNTTDK